MAPFSSDLCRHLQRGILLETELDAARDRMADRLHEAVPRADREQRRLLLEARRACFNRRPLGTAVRERLGSLAEELAVREDELGRWQEEFEDLYLRQQDGERRALAGLLDDPAFLRGVALGSPVLAENLPRLLRGRREERIETSLLRYASRAALKLSPLSTLTRAALGRVSPSAAGVGLRSSGAWQELSLVRFDRRLVDRISFLVCRHPAVRAGLAVVINETLERIDAGRYRFLRPGGPDRAGPSLLGVRLEGPFVPTLAGELARGPATFGELLLRLRSAFPEESLEALQGRVESLIDAGILRLVPPWASDDLRLEERMLEHLESLRLEDLAPLAGLLRRGLGLLQDYPGAPSSPRFLQEAGHLAGELLREAARLGGSPDLPIEPGEHPVQEDVFLRSNGPPEVVEISRSAAETLLRDLEPLVRLSNLDSRRHDLLLTLAAFARQRWPDREEVGLLDFLHAAQPLCRAWLDFDRRAEPVFNPLEIEEIGRLQHWRKTVADGIGDCLEERGGEQWLCPDSAGRLLDSVPPPYAGVLSVCAFVQPLDADGASWVLNRFLEGSGRLSSRYTAVMDEETRGLWTAHYTARLVREQDGEPAELVDLHCPLGHNLNVHALQTRRILEIPGESSPVDPDRTIRLRDLRVRLSGPGRCPAIVDPEGRRLLPVHLGGRGSLFLPELLRLLVLLGPGELRPCLPRKKPRREGDLLVGDRHRIGSAVFARRTWTFDAAVLCHRLESASDSRAFQEINRWRLERGIPDRVFLAEPVAGRTGQPHRKPQYLDFTSPLFVGIFRSAVQSAEGWLEIAEALPDPEGMPRDGGGRSWAVEVQLESLGFQPAA